MNADNNSSRHNIKYNEYNSDQCVSNTEQYDKNFGGNIQRHPRTNADFSVKYLIQIAFIVLDSTL